MLGNLTLSIYVSDISLEFGGFAASLGGQARTLMAKALRAGADKVVDHHRRFIEHWDNNKDGFEIDEPVGDEVEMSITVRNTNMIWQTVNLGNAGPRTIATSGWMSFPFQGRGESYAPKSPIEGGFGNTGPSTSGRRGRPYKTHLVRNRMIEPRRFDKRLTSNYLGMADDVYDAMRSVFGG